MSTHESHELEEILRSLGDIVPSRAYDLLEVLKGEKDPAWTTMVKINGMTIDLQEISRLSEVKRIRDGAKGTAYAATYGFYIRFNDGSTNPITASPGLPSAIAKQKTQDVRDKLEAAWLNCISNAILFDASI